MYNFNMNIRALFFIAFCGASTRENEHLVAHHAILPGTLHRPFLREADISIVLSCRRKTEEDVVFLILMIKIVDYVLEYSRFVSFLCFLLGK